MIHKIRLWLFDRFMINIYNDTMMTYCCEKESDVNDGKKFNKKISNHRTM